MELNVKGRDRVLLLVVRCTTEQEISNHVSRTIRAPSQIVRTLLTRLQTSGGLDVLAGIPVETSLQGVGTDDLGEVIVERRILLSGAELICTLEGIVHRELVDVRESPAPGTQNVGNLRRRDAK